ncbi:hypothetical protein SV7mr_29030 [Stieleria bergensis]|uniref:Planctomycete cytochrome C n=1 Tax=Stieleria bergensis TaxID=2528025 RepID=A0A517SW71_9BACT|nr:hypothetical protein SV7mr_29030 [Planctomycetes bacterium SV_7m_r]
MTQPKARKRTERYPDPLAMVATICIALTYSHAKAETVPSQPSAILQKYCVECHNATTTEGEIDLSSKHIDWTAPKNRDLWERVLNANAQQIMPPADAAQPTKAERESLTKWLDGKLLQHTSIGGTLPRRLNRSEYQATIRKLFDLPKFELPVGFPGDIELHGFTNIGEGLVVSPPLMEAYSKVAWEIAEELYPPKNPAPKSSVRIAKPDDMVLSFSAATVRDGTLRLASRANDVMRSCSWPSRIELNYSGTYRVSVSASKFLSDRGESFDDPMILEVYARPVAASERSRVQNFRLLKEIEVSSEEPETAVFDANLYEGETVLFRWKNAEMTHDPPAIRDGFEKIARANKEFLAAWLKVVYPNGNAKPISLAPLRGRVGWDSVSKHMNDPELDLTGVSADSESAEAFFKLVTKSGKTSIADSLCHYYFEYGPSLEIHSLQIEGPLKLVDSPKDLLRKRRQEKITGPRKEGMSDEAFARQMLETSLPRAFRRPVDSADLDRYLAVAKEHWDSGHSFDEGMHLLIRNILISPRFLYRSLGEGKLDDHDLATRLSYFLTGGPPDTVLVDLANRKRMSPDWVLKRESNRLMPGRASDFFVKDFTGQWLDMDLLPEIMPDPKLRFTPQYVDMARSEVEYFFATMLRENRPMTDFIDPDFTYTSLLFAKHVYQLPIKLTKDSTANRKLRRIKLERGQRAGGLLGQSAIMMATANGVDTQPVLRGVWVLENILGTPPPEPPNNIPALTPDTQGATTPRELLAAHTKDAECAACHKRIDPFGFALENFDPVGRWRTRWPKANKPIDASVVLPDGSTVQGAIELKQWAVANIDQFSQCVAEKLMTYATGRLPNHAEKAEISKIVKENRESEKGFRDLVLSLIASDTFRTH